MIIKKNEGVYMFNAFEYKQVVATHFKPMPAFLAAIAVENLI
jgi:hypothetical protein